MSLNGIKSVLPFAPGAPAAIRVGDLLGNFPVFVGIAARK
jgi:hypothetical protein